MGIKILTVCFGGEWEMKDGDCEYIGDVISKAFVLKENFKLDVMKNLIIERFKIGSSPSDISLSHLHPFGKLPAPFTIESEDDLAAFFQINEMPKVAWALPLYVSVSKKESGEGRTIEEVQMSSAAIECCQQPSSGKEHATEEEQMSSDAIKCRQQPSVVISDHQSGKQLEEVEMSSAAIECHQQPSAIISDYQVSSDAINRDQPPEIDEEHEEDENAEVDPPPDSEYVQVHQIYASKDELKRAMVNMALRENFAFKVYRSNCHSYKLKCVDEKCKWKMVALKFKGVDYFEIRKLSNGHTCPIEARRSRKIEHSYQTLGEKIKLRFEGDNLGPNPNMIRNDVRDEYSQTISYWKARKAHQWAQNLIRGTPEQNYAMLPSYCHMLQKVNTGTYTCLTIDDDSRFKYVFISVGASMKGFHQMRKVIQIDGTDLHSKYTGFLITASAQDANQQIYPIAYAVVDAENDESWKWFFEQLLNAVPCSSDVVFVSDQHSNIERSIEAVYSDAKHVLCTRHLGENLKTRFRERGIHQLFTKAAESYKSSDFNKYFQGICKMNAEMGHYLMATNFEKWSRANFCGDRYNIMAMDKTETIVSAVKEKEARSFPIVALLEFIRDLLSQWFNERRKNVENSSNQLPTKVREVLEERCSKSKRYGVKQLNNDEFEVFLGTFTGVVDLSRRTCSCKMFDLDKLPCTHAIAAIEHMKYKPSDFVSGYYQFQPWYMAYQETIYPLPLKSDWDVPEDVSKIVCGPPNVRRKSGRPRKSKLPSVDEAPLTKKRKRSAMALKCGTCGISGHYKKTCPTKSAKQSDMVATVQVD